MKTSFWETLWQENEIGFNQEKTNDLLVKFFPRLEAKPNDKIFVPLCGKSVDMLWLREQGLEVIGVELSAIACEDFFKEIGVVPDIYQVDNFTVYEKNKIKLYCGDFFDLTPAILANTHAVYDRAAFIALPPELRKVYAAHLIKILPAESVILLLTLSYEGERDAPPFSIDRNEVDQLFSSNYAIDELDISWETENMKRLKAREFVNPVDAIFLLKSFPFKRERFLKAKI